MCRARDIFRDRVRKFSFDQLIRNDLTIVLTGIMERYRFEDSVCDRTRFRVEYKESYFHEALVTRIFLLDRVRKLHKFDLLILTRVTSDHMAKRRFLNN